MSKKVGVAAAAHILKKSARDLEKNIVSKVLFERVTEVVVSEDLGDDEMEIQVDPETYKSIKDEEELGKLLIEASVKMAELGLPSTTIEQFLKGAGESLFGTPAAELGRYLRTVAADVKEGKLGDGEGSEGGKGDDE